MLAGPSDVSFNTDSLSHLPNSRPKRAPQSPSSLWHSLLSEGNLIIHLFAYLFLPRGISREQEATLIFFKEVDQSPWSVPGLGWGAICWRERKEEMKGRKKRRMGRRRDNKKEEGEMGMQRRRQGRGIHLLSGTVTFGLRMYIFSGSKTVVLTASQAPWPLYREIFIQGSPTQWSWWWSCSWNLHLKRDFLVPRPSVEHPTAQLWWSVTGDDGRLHQELRHQGFGFLLESKHTVCWALETITTP